MLSRLNIRRAVIGLASTAVIASLAIAPAGAATSAKPAPAPAPPATPVAHGASALSPRSARISPLASQDGSCDVGDLCLYYFSNFVGSRYDTSHNDPTLFDNHFITVREPNRASASVITLIARMARLIRERPDRPSTRRPSRGPLPGTMTIERIDVVDRGDQSTLFTLERVPDAELLDRQGINEPQGLHSIADPDDERDDVYLAAVLGKRRG